MHWSLSLGLSDLVFILALAINIEFAETDTSFLTTYPDNYCYSSFFYNSYSTPLSFSLFQPSYPF